VSCVCFFTVSCSFVVTLGGHISTDIGNMCNQSTLCFYDVEMHQVNDTRVKQNEGRREADIFPGAVAGSHAHPLPFPPSPPIFPYFSHLANGTEDNYVEFIDVEGKLLYRLSQAMCTRHPKTLTVLVKFEYWANWKVL
jgi:hypothetical protein